MDYPCILTLRLARKEGEELYGQSKPVEAVPLE